MPTLESVVVDAVVRGDLWLVANFFDQRLSDDSTTQQWRHRYIDFFNARSFGGQDFFNC